MDTLERLYTTHFKTLDTCGREAAQASEAACDLVGDVNPGGGQCVWATHTGGGWPAGRCVAEPVDVLIGRNGFGATTDVQAALDGVATCVRDTPPLHYQRAVTMGQSGCDHDSSCGGAVAGAWYPNPAATYHSVTLADMDVSLISALNHCPAVRPDISTGRWRGYPAQCHNASSCLITVSTSRLHCSKSCP